MSADGEGTGHSTVQWLDGGRGIKDPGQREGREEWGGEEQKIRSTWLCGPFPLLFLPPTESLLHEVGGDTRGEPLSLIAIFL